MAPKQSSNRDASEFASLVGDVKPICQNRVHLRKKHTDNVSIHYRKEAASRDIETHSDGLSDRLSTVVESEQALEFSSPGVQHRLFQRMRLGHLAWEEGLDLHGHTVDDARDQLSRFIRDARRRQYRCVLVVHGKAANTEGRTPLLKSYVNDWLRQLPQVLAFASAQPKDGGTGAVYVLLKRDRHQ